MKSLREGKKSKGVSIEAVAIEARQDRWKGDWRRGGK